MRQPVGLADVVPSTHEDILHNQVKAALLLAQHRPGILDTHFDIQRIELEMRAGEAHHLGVEFYPHDAGLGRQGTHDPGGAPPAEAEQQHPAAARRRQGQQGGRQGIPNAARSGAPVAVEGGKGLVDDQAFAETIALDTNPRRALAAATRR